MTSSIKIFKQYKDDCRILIETGHWLGEGTERALQAGYEKVYTCDINPEFISNAKSKYPDGNVIAEALESHLFLEKVLSEIDERVVIFLDAHFMPDSTGEKFGEITVKEGIESCPLIRELEVIKNHHIKDHVILIDDFQCFDTWMFEYLQLDTIYDFIKTINKNYKHKLVDNVLCFKVSK